MIVTSQSANALGCISGSWKIWSLSDGYVDMPADLLRRGPGLGKYAPPGLAQQEPSLVRLSVNCFLLEGPGNHGVLIDCGAGGKWEPSLGHLDSGDGRGGYRSILDRRSRSHPYPSRPFERAFDARWSRGVSKSEQDRDRARCRREFCRRAAPGAFSAPACPGQGRRTFERSLVGTGGAGARAGSHGLRSELGRGPARVLRRPDPCPRRTICPARLTWAYDLNQSIACSTRINLLREASNTRAWLAGAHMAKPGIGRIVEEGSGYAFLPIA